MIDSLSKIAESYKILISSQHTYLIELYESLKKSLEKDDYAIRIVELFDQLLEQINVYYETAEVLMSIALYDKFFELTESKRELMNVLNDFRPNINSYDKNEIAKQIEFIELILSKHINQMNDIVDYIADKAILEEISLAKEDVLGISVIDYQHNKLSELLFLIVDKTQIAYDKEEINDLYYEFIQKFKQHAAFEEYYFRQYNYPEYEVHKKEHKKFISNQIIAKNKLYSGMFDINPLEHFKHLIKEVIAHIEVHDMKYNKFIEKKKHNSH